MAELPERPVLAKSPAELFEQRYDTGVPYINFFWLPALAGVMGFTAVCYANYVTRRPYFSGIQKHIAVSAALAYGAKYLDDWKSEHMAERDAILRDYIRLHPEDFPPFDRKKYSEVLEPWVPIR